MSRRRTICRDDWKLIEGGVVDGEFIPDVWVTRFLFPSTLAEFKDGQYEDNERDSGMLSFRMRDDFGELKGQSLYERDVQLVGYYLGSTLLFCQCPEFFAFRAECVHTKAVKLVVQHKIDVSSFHFD